MPGARGGDYQIGPNELYISGPGTYTASGGNALCYCDCFPEPGPYAKR